MQRDKAVFVVPFEAYFPYSLVNPAEKTDLKLRFGIEGLYCISHEVYSYRITLHCVMYLQYKVCVYYWAVIFMIFTMKLPSILYHTLLRQRNLIPKRDSPKYSC